MLALSNRLRIAERGAVRDLILPRQPVTFGYEVLHTPQLSVQRVFRLLNQFA
jgi:hypothetical protein